MTDALSVFVQQGIRRYADARQTVEFFETHVYDVLQAAVSNAVAAGPIERADAPDRRRAPGGSGTEWWLSFGENVLCKSGILRLEVGVWWGVQRSGAAGPVIVYANFRDGDPILARFPFQPHPDHPGVRELRFPKWTRVQVAVSEPADLTRDVEAVLTVLKFGVAAAIEKVPAPR